MGRLSCEAFLYQSSVCVIHVYVFFALCACLFVVFFVEWCLLAPAAALNSQ